MILRLIYTLFIGVFLAIFVGVGISAFYKGPTPPDMPATLKYCSPEIGQNAAKFAEFKTQADAYDTLEKKFQKQLQVYNRNVSLIAILAATALVIVSLTFLRTILLISDGILLGGVFTLLYSVIRGFSAEDTRFQFFVVSVGLLISLVLGYIKFIKPTISSSSKKK